MKLWHELLIPVLPSKLLVNQHRECCILRGLGWNNVKDTQLDYVFKIGFQYGYSRLYDYHVRVMEEMKKRGEPVSSRWFTFKYRGRRIGYDNRMKKSNITYYKTVYFEHNEKFLIECLDELRQSKQLLSR